MLMKQWKNGCTCNCISCTRCTVYCTSNNKLHTSLNLLIVTVRDMLKRISNAALSYNIADGSFRDFSSSYTRCIQDQTEKSKQKENGSSQKGNYFFEYLKASIADLITLLSSSLRDGDGGDSFADPCQEFNAAEIFPSLLKNAIEKWRVQRRGREERELMLCLRLDILWSICENPCLS